MSFHPPWDDVFYRMHIDYMCFLMYLRRGLKGLSMDGVGVVLAWKRVGLPVYLPLS
jgi:hypothetical protein